jgi:hypothetical protein
MSASATPQIRFIEANGSRPFVSEATEQLRSWTGRAFAPTGQQKRREPSLIGATGRWFDTRGSAL